MAERVKEAQHNMLQLSAKRATFNKLVTNRKTCVRMFVVVTFRLFFHCLGLREMIDLTFLLIVAAHLLML